MATILAAILGKKQNYTFEKCFIVFLDLENPTIDTRINVVDTIDVELCVKIYVAANCGQYGRHPENVVSYDIHKYLVVFLDPKNLHLDTKIITVSILKVKINFNKKGWGPSWPPSWPPSWEKNKITHLKNVSSYSLTQKTLP